jgi:CPA2 family monovalent cation:H+ antiporter-2
MLLTPLLVPLARRAGETLESKSNQNEYGNVEFNEADGYVVVFGFGRVGMAIAEMLCKEGLRVISFENDLTRVHAAQLKSTSVFYGDACKKSTIEAARLEKASCAVVTTDDPKNTYDIVCSIRKLHANIPIIVRALTDGDVNKFEEQANIEAVAEHKLISEELTKITLFYYGFDQADEIVAA